MKILLFLALLVSNFSYSQSIEIRQIDNNEMVRLMNESILFSTNNTSDLFFKVYTLSNEPGSAGYANGEVTQKLYIAVSEDGEGPDQKLYIVGSFYAPKPVSWDNKNSKDPEFTIEYGEYNSKKKITFIIGLDKLIIK